LYLTFLIAGHLVFSVLTDRPKLTFLMLTGISSVGGIF
jgi:hypothetical protein